MHQSEFYAAAHYIANEQQYQQRPCLPTENVPREELPYAAAFLDDIALLFARFIDKKKKARTCHGHSAGPRAR